ncbi:alternative oxidase mitochondrial [Hordeum vulgare]|nr:alternative oxidase mitochondrial [Hordeum vulgare]
MGVGSNNWSQTNEVHGDVEMDEDGEGIFEAPKGRAGNYNTDEDILLCNACSILHKTYLGEEKKNKKGKIKKGRAFVLPHWYDLLKGVEKWKARDDQEESKKRRATVNLGDEEEASSDDGNRNPTPNSVAYSKPK